MAEKSSTALKEEEVLEFWADKKVFEQSLNKPAPKGEFVFYDGPPFATGLPHSGSLLSSVSKDLIPRYKTMRGYKVRRRWGWDTHGLPIENLVEKKLGLKNKKEILQLGVEKFNTEARSLVLEYVQDWKRYVERVGRWVDFDNSYKTMDASYTESVWWGLKQIHDKGNLYEGRKVLMYCPHCETVLAKAEIAMDNTYKDITEESVYTKFRLLTPEALGVRTPAFMVAWTTTPWTLPGNVALAVGPDIDYVFVENNGETLIVAKERGEALGLAIAGEVVKGSKLVGQLYEPLYALEKVKAHAGKKWQVLSADFVTTTDGSGIVHTAVIYGEDDYALGLKEGLPMVPILSPNATYNDDAPEFIRGEYIKKAETKIKDDLESRGLLFKKEVHTHSYPHCYRCGTPLIYNAVSSWFINIQAVKDKMLAENEKVTWFPEHLKHGRFMKNLESAPDWTISRNRFWASPLPIWKSAAGEVTVVGSLDELKSLTKKSGNTYFVMRHGESEKNVAGVARGVLSDDDVHLTEKGKIEAKTAATTLKDKGIDLIVTSPFIRAKETADIVRKQLGLTTQAMIVDERLHEYNYGVFDRRPITEFLATYKSGADLIDTAPQSGESIMDVKRRAGDFLYDMEKRYAGKNILVVAHGWPLAPLLAASRGANMDQTARIAWDEMPEPGEVQKLLFEPIPHNRDYELDYHLPFIDEVQLEKDGKALKRIPEVVDCWVESGAMPFAEYHYPFENKEQFEKRTPGDFVSEYIGQTRAWFYYMHAVSVQLFGHLAFRHVITTGNINAGDGQKLSKSKKNYTDPYVLFDQYGADAFRYYLMSSVVMQAEDMQFRDEDVKEIHGRVVNILRNTLSFYELFKSERVPQKGESGHPLDRWILSRTNQLIVEVTSALDVYDVTRAARPIRLFVEDFSTWYVRRSRDRMKGDNAADKQAALNTMHLVFTDVSRLFAPFMPFIAEEIHQSIRTKDDPESVHLTDWPEPWPIEEDILADMAEVRRVVSLALEARQSSGIKVRQPLQQLLVNSSLLIGKQDLLKIIGEEINVKEVLVNEGQTEEVKLDTTLTDALRDEGELRDLLREVQDLRKSAGLNPKDVAVLEVPSERKAVVDKHWVVLAKATSLNGQEVGPVFGVRRV